MNKENRQKVLEYCADHDAYPLYFNQYESNKDEFDPNKHSVDSMVIRVLELSGDYSSYNANTCEFETTDDRHRSLLDIWRHIIYYYPTVEIFDVMHSLYNLYYHSVRGQYCMDIQRRTFKLGKGDDDFMSPEEMYVYCRRYRDEFDLKWEDWKNI